MRRFVEEADRAQWTLLPECLDDFIDESNPVRVIDVSVEALDLAEMSFEGVEPAATGRPSYHPSVLLKLYIYGYLNWVAIQAALISAIPLCDIGGNRYHHHSDHAQHDKHVDIGKECSLALHHLIDDGHAGSG
jgi:hypothetical protein